MHWLSKYLAIVLIAIPVIGFSQHSVIPQPEEKWADLSGEIIIPEGSISTSLVEADWIEAAGKFAAMSLGLAPADLVVEHQNTSPIGRHIGFVQSWKGIPIFGTSAKLNTAPDGKVTSLLYKIADTKQWPGYLSPMLPDPLRIQNITGAYEISRLESAWYFTGEEHPIPAILVEYGARDGSMHRLAVLDENYTVVYSMDKHRYFDGPPDSLVTGYVFLPDPLTSAKRTYGGDYKDYGDSAVFALDFERVPVDIRVKYDTGVFSLAGPYAFLADVQKPNTPATISTIPLFNFSRHESGFEDINVFYHIHAYQQYIQSLGFPSLGNIPLKVDAHAQGGDDQSEFDFFNKNDLKLLFGTGGVDDAEDADVIVHEYGHFLSYMAAGDNAYGAERLALEEGLSDYFACSYSKALSAYGWERVYSWDGNNQFWPGRSCVTVKQYPKDLKGNKWADGELWAGPLMEIYDAIGREVTDELMLATLYSFGKNISISTAAMLFLQSDSILNGGANAKVIREKFAAHGILAGKVGIDEKPAENTGIKLLTGNGFATLAFTEPGSGEVAVYDLQGRVISTQNFRSSQTVKIPTGNLPGGIYLIHVRQPGQVSSLKLIKP